MSKFTDGPWSLPHFANEESGCSCAYVFSESQRGFGSVATVSFGGEDEDYETAKANAKLISAAPDLLEALINLKREIVLSDISNESIEKMYPFIVEARKAIAKALA